MTHGSLIFSSGLGAALSLFLVPAVAQSPAGAINAAGGPSAPPAVTHAPASRTAPGGTAAAAALSILVYDNNTQHNLAQIAAQVVSPAGTVVADTSTFDNLLLTGAWDVVAVDCPSTLPAGGWTALITYVQSGGHVILSFWDWDGSGGGAPLMNAFECSLAATFTWTGQTLFDSGTSSVFSGVTMPNSDWHNHWGDDGDLFVPLGTAAGIANLGNPLTPCFVLGNGGKTIAAPCIDEAGDTWINDGSGVWLWRNMIEYVAGAGAQCTPRAGVLGLNPSDCACGNLPVLGTTWNPTVVTTPSLGSQTIATFIAIGMGGPTQGVAALGGELLILPPYFASQALGTHSIPIANDPVMLGWVGFAQGLRVETNGTGALFFVPTNALDIVTGL